LQIWQISIILMHHMPGFRTLTRVIIFDRTKKRGLLALWLTIFLNPVTNCWELPVRRHLQLWRDRIVLVTFAFKSIVTGCLLGSKSQSNVLQPYWPTVNATGSHKLEPLIINKWQTPRSLKNIDKTSLPCLLFLE